MNNNCNELYKKALKYKNLIGDFIPIDLWEHVISKLDNDLINKYLNEEDKYVYLQLPITKFGIFLHNTIYDFLLKKCIDNIQSNVYDLESFTINQVINFLTESKIALKAFISFMYSKVIENKPKDKKVIILSKTNAKELLKCFKEFDPVKLKINIIEPFRKIKCCFSDKKCITFRNACLLGHYLCATEYINNGCIFTNKECIATFFSNNKIHLERMTQLGMRISKASLSLSINYNLNESVNYLLESKTIIEDQYLLDLLINSIFLHWNTKYCKIENYLYYLNNIAKLYPFIFIKINNLLSFEFFRNLEIEEKKYDELYKIKSNYVKQFEADLKRIENHLFLLLNKTGYYKL